jgi:uncharacterized glyoxalase superfamily protein PhnB
MTASQFLKTTIILPVSDIYDTIAWYERALGFSTVYVHGEGKRGEAENFANYLIMRRDAVEVQFILDEGGAVWTRAGTGHLGLTVRDVDAVYAEVQASGIPITQPLKRQNWPALAFHLTDPSGNDVAIEQRDA